MKAFNEHYASQASDYEKIVAEDLVIDIRQKKVNSRDVIVTMQNKSKADFYCVLDAAWPIVIELNESIKTKIKLQPCHPGILPSHGKRPFLEAGKSRTFTLSSVFIRLRVAENPPSKPVLFVFSAACLQFLKIGSYNLNYIFPVKTYRPTARIGDQEPITEFRWDEATKKSFIYKSGFQVKFTDPNVLNK